jgi:hypothetical protein
VFGEAAAGSDGGAASAGEIVAIGAEDAFDDAEMAQTVRPTGALEPFHSRLGRRPVLAYRLLGFTILQGGCSHGQGHSAADQEWDLD